jgi:hypothetical protein
MLTVGGCLRDHRVAGDPTVAEGNVRDIWLFEHWGGRATVRDRIVCTEKRFAEPTVRHDPGATLDAIASVNRRHPILRKLVEQSEAESALLASRLIG